MILKRSALDTKNSARQIEIKLDEILMLMWGAKPSDGSALDRKWAIAITEMEKFTSFFKTHISIQVFFVVCGVKGGDTHILGMKASRESAEALAEKWEDHYELIRIEDWEVGGEL